MYLFILILIYFFPLFSRCTNVRRTLSSHEPGRNLTFRSWGSRPCPPSWTTWPGISRSWSTAAGSSSWNLTWPWTCQVKHRSPKVSEWKVSDCLNPFLAVSLVFHIHTFFLLLLFFSYSYFSVTFSFVFHIHTFFCHSFVFYIHPFLCLSLGFHILYFILFFFTVIHFSYPSVLIRRNCLGLYQFFILPQCPS